MRGGGDSEVEEEVEGEKNDEKKEEVMQGNQTKKQDEEEGCKGNEDWDVRGGEEAAVEEEVKLSVL